MKKFGDPTGSEWKDIKGYEGRYMVSNSGLVKSLRKDTKLGDGILTPAVHRQGYLRVHLVDDGGAIKSWYVHRLVALNFIDNRAGNLQVNHIDGDKANNRVDNLEFCTASSNMKHAVKNGLVKMPNLRGEDCYNTKLKERDVIEIRTKHADGVPIGDILEEYMITLSCLKHIIYKQTWKHLI